jgi:hypothetical protein
MAVPGGTFQTYQAVGNAEDFENAIFDISPTETPILMLAKKLKATNVSHQWQTDELTAHTAGNAVIQGDDAAGDTAVPTVMLKNYCQLMDKVPFVADTQEATEHYGRDSEMAYQMAKRSKELKRDLEAALCQNNAGTVGAAASAALMASLESWLAYGGQQAATIKTASGTSVGTGTLQTTPGFTTANGVPVTAPTDSTVTGSISESVLKNAIADTYTAGGDPRVILVPPRIKQKISTAFSGVATRFRDVKSGSQAQIIGGADLYVSDFGTHEIMPSRFMRTSVLFGIDPDYIGVAYLQPFSQVELARTGHAMKRMLKVQATLVLQNPFAHFKIADINPAL